MLETQSKKFKEVLMETSIFILEERFALYKGDISTDLLYYLFDTQDGRIFRLNKVSFAILELIDGKKTISDIMKILKERFNVEEDRLRKDVYFFISKLQEKKIIKEVK